MGEDGSFKRFRPSCVKASMFNLLSEEWVLGTEIESAGTSGEGERSEGIEEA